MLVTPSQALSMLDAGQVVAIPTETVYGLAADARSESALTLLYRTKGRPSEHPVILHVNGVEMCRPYVTEIPSPALALMKAFWPGPLTLLLPRSGLVSDRITGGRPLVGVRVPAAPLALALLTNLGRPLVAPSANRFGHISPTTAAHVEAEFGGAVAVLDGGACSVGLESTILAVERERLLVLRPGQLLRLDLQEVAGLPVEDPEVVPEEGVPGALKSHYAPHQPVLLMRLEQMLVERGQGVALLMLSSEGAWPDADLVRRLPTTASDYAHHLYGALRDAEASGCSRILIELPPAAPEWQAVHDRLARASAR